MFKMCSHYTFGYLKHKLWPKEGPRIKCQFDSQCRNPSLGLMTKARACKGVGQKGSSKVTYHALGSVGECEGMNPHTPKLGIKSPNGLLNLQRTIAKVKTHWIETLLISLESSWKLNV
jgi:hypothetical protein